MLDHASDELVSNDGQTVLRARSVKDVLAGLVDQRGVQVVPRALIFVDGHAHKRRDDAVHISDLLDQGLEEEGAIGGLDCLAVCEVDLVLRVAVLLRHRDRLQLERIAGVEHRTNNPGRVCQRPNRVNARIPHRHRAQTTNGLCIAFKEIELELVGDNGCQAELPVPGADALERTARVEPRWAVARNGREVAENNCHLRVQGIDASGLQIGHGEEIPEALGLATDDVVAVVDGHDGLHERLTVGDRVAGALQEHVLAALLAMKIGVDEAQDAYARGFEFLNCGHPGLPPNCRYTVQRLADMILINSFSPTDWSQHAGCSLCNNKW